MSSSEASFQRSINTPAVCPCHLRKMGYSDGGEVAQEKPNQRLRCPVLHCSQFRMMLFEIRGNIQRLFLGICCASVTGLHSQRANGFPLPCYVSAKLLASDGREPMFAFLSNDFESPNAYELFPDRPSYFAQDWCFVLRKVLDD